MGAVEFVELVAGLPADCQLKQFFLAARVKASKERELSREEWLKAITRHQGQVEIVEV